MKKINLFLLLLCVAITFINIGYKVAYEKFNRLHREHKIVIYKSLNVAGLSE